MKTDNIKLIVVSPEKKLFEGMVRFVEMTGINGLFTVLYNHAPLITALTEGHIKYKSQNQLYEIPIKDGFVEINDNEVSICVQQ